MTGTARFMRMIKDLKSVQPHKALHKELILFFIVVGLWGFGSSVNDTIFNNFLHETFSLTSFDRTFLELPREFPGFLTIFVTALLFFMCSKRLASFALILAGIGLVCTGFFSFNYAIMLLWLFLYSSGLHLFLPLFSSIGMEYSHENKEGRRLGQLNGIRNAAVVVGSCVIFAGFRFFHFDFKISFTIGACALVMAGCIMLFFRKGEAKPAGQHLKLYKEYKLFYWLSVLYGARKQIFLTFAPWVIVTVFNKPTTVVAILLMVGGIIGIIFQPALGLMVDRLGEKKILMIEGFALVFVCLGYGFAKNIFSGAGDAAFYLACVCYIFDNLLMSFGIARSTYLKKIAVKPEHVSSTLSMSTTMDHVFSISIALLGGTLWTLFGFQAVFVCGAVIAFIYMISAARIKIAGGARATSTVSAR